MTDFSDCIDYVDRVKLEFHERFRHLLEVNAQLEERIAALEGDRRLPKEWFTEPCMGYWSKYPPWYKTHGLTGPPHEEGE